MLFIVGLSLVRKCATPWAYPCPSLPITTTTLTRENALPLLFPSHPNRIVLFPSAPNPAPTRLALPRPASLRPIPAYLALSHPPRLSSPYPAPPFSLRYFLGSSWRSMIIVSSVFITIIDMPFTFLTVYGVVRNQYFYLDDALVTSIPAAASFIVSTYVMVEIAEPGLEGITYGAFP